MIKSPITIFLIVLSLVLVSLAVVCGLPTFFHSYCDYPNVVSSWSRRYWCDLKAADASIAVFTCLLAAFTIWLALSTERLVSGAELTANRQLRAWVMVSRVVVHRMPSRFSIYVQNHGTTPAAGVRVYVRAAYAASGLPLAGHLEDCKEFNLSAGPLGPNEPRYIVQECDGLPVTLAETQERPRMGWYIFGEVLYTDIFHHSQKTEFAYFAKNNGQNEIEAGRLDWPVRFT